MSYEVFEKLCKQRGVRTIDVSRKTEVSTATFTNWKQGKYTPKVETLQRIADYFGVTVDFLKTGKTEDGFYLNEETAKAAQELFENSDMRVLFDAAKDSKPEDLQMAADLLKRLKETNPDG